MATTFRLSTQALTSAQAHAADAHPVEACGLLLGREGAAEQALPCRNVAADPAVRFEIDPATLLAAHRGARAGGPAVIGCYHSHPSGSAAPSPRDASDAAPDGGVWLILAGGEARAWRAVQDGTLHGRFDPLTIEHPRAFACGAGAAAAQAAP
jgi:proteasome lid subunit RPN8/RPN11